jgi:hypothetical protein
MMFWLAVLVAASSPAVKKPKVAVLNVEARGLEADKVPLLTEVLSTELGKSGDLDVIAGRDIEAILGFEAQKQLLGCDEASCVAELGGALGADELVVGQVGKIGETFVVNVKLIDVKEMKTTHRVSLTTGTDLDSMLSGMRRAAQDIVEARTGGKFLGIGAVPAAFFGGGLLATAAGVFFGLKAKEHHDNATTPGYSGAQLEVDRGISAQRFANVGYALGLASVITGVVVIMRREPNAHLALARHLQRLRRGLLGLTP